MKGGGGGGGARRWRRWRKEGVAGPEVSGKQMRRWKKREKYGLIEMLNKVRHQRKMTRNRRR